MALNFLIIATLGFFISAALRSIFAYRVTKSKLNQQTLLNDYRDLEQAKNDAPDIDWTTFDGDPKEQQGYYISQGHDGTSSFYEVRQYQDDNCVDPRHLMSHPWLPGIDREFALVLTSEFSREQYSSYWQTIFVLDCKHYLPSIHKIESAREETYCFICRDLSNVVKIVSRKSVFPSEGESIKTREDWKRRAEVARDSRNQDNGD